MKKSIATNAIADLHSGDPRACEQFIRLIILYLVPCIEIRHLRPYRAICKRFYDAISLIDCSLILPWDSNITAEQIELLLKRYKNITDIDMRNVREHKLRKKQFKSLLESRNIAVLKHTKKLKSFQAYADLTREEIKWFRELPYLQHLTLSSISKKKSISEQFLQNISQLPALNSLCLPDYKNLNMSMLTPLRHQLTSLNVDLSSVSAGSVMSEFTNLRELYVYAGPPSGFRISWLKALTNLQQLHPNTINGEETAATISQVFNGFQQLRELTLSLRISADKNIWRSIMETLARLPKLERVTLFGDEGNDQDMSNMLLPLRDSTSLRRLDLEFNGNHPEILETFQTLTQLQELHIVDGEMETSPLYVYDIKEMTQLEVLWLDLIVPVHPGKFAKTLEPLKRLRYLYLPELDEKS